SLIFFLFTLPSPPDFYTLSLHDALPILLRVSADAAHPLGSGRMSDQIKAASFDARLPSLSLHPPLPAWLARRLLDPGEEVALVQIGRAHVWTPVTFRSRMPSSA